MNITAASVFIENGHYCVFIVGNGMKNYEEQEVTFTTAQEAADYVQEHIKIPVYYTIRPSLE